MTKKQEFLLSPSLRGGNLLDITKSVRQAERAKADGLHVDVMDGHYAPDFGFNAQLISQVAQLTRLKIDVHVMAEDVERLILPFLELPINTVYFHPDACKRPDLLIGRVKNKGLRAGLAIHPAVRIWDIESQLTAYDEVLVMTVNPGEGGGAFHADCLDKITEIGQTANQRRIPLVISVDGGMDTVRAAACIKKGADKIIMGTAFYQSTQKRMIRRKIIRMI